MHTRSKSLRNIQRVARPFPQSERSKKIKISFEDWISPSRIKNFMLNDPIIDFLKISRNKHSRKTLDNQQVSFLKQQGIDFESKILNLLKQRIGNQFVFQVAHSKDDIKNPIKFEYTQHLIAERVPVIYQGVLYDYEKKLFGCPDLIIRADYLHYLTETAISIKEPGYVIVDIKFMTLMLKADGKHLLNSGFVPYYKGQLLFYNSLLSKIIGYTPEHAFIIGRGLDIHPNNPFAGLAYIGVTKDAKYLAQKDKAIEWLRDLSENHLEWSILPKPTRKELYPNMCNKNDDGYREEKQNIAEKLGDITQMWQCGVKHREKAFSLGIHSWHNITDVSQLGLTNTKRSMIIQRMIDFNNGKIGKNVSVIPKKIKNNQFDWQNSTRMEFYIDFEVFNNLFVKDQFVFLFGIIYFDLRGKEVYKPFIAHSLDEKEEGRIATEFCNYIDEVSVKYGEEDPLLIHWSGAEVRFFEGVQERHEVEFKSDVTFFDFLQVFHDDGILVKGAFNFSLKTIAKEMAKNRLIPAMDETDCKNGMDAMVNAFENYNSAVSSSSNEKSIAVKDLMKRHEDVIKYNRNDCLMLANIVKYLRKHHTK